LLLFIQRLALAAEKRSLLVEERSAQDFGALPI